MSPRPPTRDAARWASRAAGCSACGYEFGGLLGLWPTISALLRRHPRIAAVILVLLAVDFTLEVDPEAGPAPRYHSH